MSKLPAITSREAIRAFGKAGFAVVRTHGSHTILAKEGHRYHLSIPVHKGRTLPRGLLRTLIRAAGLTEQEFRSLL